MPLFRILLKSSPMIASVAILALAARASAKTYSAPSESPRTLFSGASGYVLLPPELIAAPVVEEAIASPNGRYLLIRRSSEKVPAVKLATNDPSQLKKDAVSETSLIVWDDATRTSREVWRSEGAEVKIESMEWLPKATVALASTREIVPSDPNQPDQTARSRKTILAIEFHGSARVVAKTDLSASDNLELFVSPSRPSAILLDLSRALDSQKEKADFASIIDSSGRSGAWFRLPVGVQSPFVLWDSDGEPILVSHEKDPDSERRKNRWFSVNPSSDGWIPLETKPAHFFETAIDANPAKADPFEIVSTKSEIKEGEGSASLDSLWLKGVYKNRQTYALLCADCSDGELLLDQSLLTYRSQGALWATPFLTMDGAMAENLMQSAEMRARRAKLMNNAKLIAVALVGLYANDNNQTLPDPKNFTAITPYLKDPEMLNGFVYAYKGGPLVQIEDPAKTEIGYSIGPGGRVVLYADGHVKWNNNEP